MSGVVRKSFPVLYRFLSMDVKLRDKGFVKKMRVWTEM